MHEAQSLADLLDLARTVVGERDVHMDDIGGDAAEMRGHAVANDLDHRIHRGGVARSDHADGQIGRAGLSGLAGGGHGFARLVHDVTG
jgi:hypothetical protein